MISPDSSLPDDSETGEAPEKCVVSVPVAALALDGNNPAEGDEVDFKGTGRVVSIDGDTATIELATINDADVTEGPEPGEDTEDAAMRDAASKADANPNY
jgi:hypothetical protein